MSSALESKLAEPLTEFSDSLKRVDAYLERLSQLNALYRAGNIHAHVPDALHEDGGTLDEVVGQYLPASHSALQAASQGLFFSLPVAFDPSESVGPYLAAVDRDAAGQPYRFLDMGAQIATHAFGENDPDTVRAVLESLPFTVDRYAHSEYQTVLSLRLKAALNRRGACRHAAPLHRQHGSGGRRERDQGRADEPRDDDRGSRRRVRRLVRGRVSRTHAGLSRGHAPQEGAAWLSDVRLAAHSVPVRRAEIAEGDACGAKTGR